jgi:RNA recognition motif-containing protein
MKNQLSGREIYVSEISFAATEEDLRKLFSLCGRISSLHLVTDPTSGQFKGSAFIRMGSAAEAKDAVGLDGTRLLDRCIAVSPARPKAPPAAAKAPRPEKLPRPARPQRRRR